MACRMVDHRDSELHSAGVFCFHYGGSGVWNLSGRASRATGPGGSHSLRVSPRLGYGMGERFQCGCLFGNSGGTMKLCLLLCTTLFWLAASILSAQTAHERETYRSLTTPQTVSDTLPGPKYMREHVVDGKLRLTLQELNVESAKYSLLNAHSPFDPLIQASFIAQRSISQPFTELAAVPSTQVP